MGLGGAVSVGEMNEVNEVERDKDFGRDWSP